MVGLYEDALGAFHGFRLEKGIFTKDELDAILSPYELTEPGIAGGLRFKPRLPEGYEPPTGPAHLGGAGREAGAGGVASPALPLRARSSIRKALAASARRLA